MARHVAEAAPAAQKRVIQRKHRHAVVVAVADVADKHGNSPADSPTLYSIRVSREPQWRMHWRRPINSPGDDAIGVRLLHGETLPSERRGQPRRLADLVPASDDRVLPETPTRVAFPATYIKRCILHTNLQLGLAQWPHREISHSD